MLSSWRRLTVLQDLKQLNIITKDESQCIQDMFFQGMYAQSGILWSSNQLLISLKYLCGYTDVVYFAHPHIIVLVCLFAFFVFSSVSHIACPISLYSFTDRKLNIDFFLLLCMLIFQQKKFFIELFVIVNK